MLSWRFCNFCVHSSQHNLLAFIVCFGIYKVMAPPRPSVCFSTTAQSLSIALANTSALPDNESFHSRVRLVNRLVLRSDSSFRFLPHFCFLALVVSALSKSAELCRPELPGSSAASHCAIGTAFDLYSAGFSGSGCFRALVQNEAKVELLSPCLATGGWGEPT